MAFNLLEKTEQMLNQYGNEAQQASRGIPDNTYRMINEPQHAYSWEFTVNGFTADQDIRLFAQEVTIPSQQQEVITKEYRGIKIPYQGKTDTNQELSVTFYDTQDLPVYRFFYMWYRTMNEIKTNNSVEPANYMKECSITLLDTTEKISTGEYKFTQVFPISIDEVSLDYAANEIMNVTVNLSYLDMEFGTDDTSSIDNQVRRFS